MKKMILLLLSLFVLSGCSSGTQITGCPLDAAVSAINNSNEAYLLIDDVKTVSKLPIELDSNLDKTADNIDINNPKKIIYALHKGSVFVVGIYQENTHYYLASYAYSLASTLDKAVIPKDTTNVSVYKATEEVIKQIENIIEKE